MTSILLCLAVVAAGEAGGEGASASATWRSPKKCGPNCLYAYLKLHGRPATLEAINARVPVTEEGSALGDLWRAANDLGVPSRVVKTRPTELGGWPLPVIAHLQVREGHFVLLVDATPQAVTTADLSSGQVQTMPADQFYEIWSGYLLVPDSGRGWGRASLMAFGLAAVLMVYTVSARRRAVV